jgi:hypothetical protein
MFAKNAGIFAFILWYQWACLLNINVFISNPGIPYVGWLLLAHAFLSIYYEVYEVCEAYGTTETNSKYMSIRYHRYMWLAWF